MNILVTGATGFLGGALARQLQKDGYAVNGLGRNPVKGAALERDGITFLPVDLRDTSAVLQACRGNDWVFHAGAKTAVWGSKQEFWDSNVLGTRNIAQACLQQGVQRLIHISSPSIYFQFTDRYNITEDSILPKHFANDYIASKYAGEQEVLQTVNKGLEAVILRPRAIFGPGDNTIFPKLLQALQGGRLRIIGNGQNQTDLTYIDNCVLACILAAKATLQYSGRAYNITDGTSISLWGALQNIATELSLQLPSRKVSPRLARLAAKLQEGFHRRFRPNIEPTLTEYSAGLLYCNITLSIERARQELTYQPTISTQDGLQLFLDWWKETQC